MRLMINDELIRALQSVPTDEDSWEKIYELCQTDFERQFYLIVRNANLVGYITATKEATEKLRSLVDNHLV